MSKILAFHIYELEKIESIIKKLNVIINSVDSIWISSPKQLKLSSLQSLFPGKELKLFEVNNDYFDWSGYLAFLSSFDGKGTLIIANDTIVSRRLLSKYSVLNFLETTSTSSLFQDRFIVGDIDTAKESVNINGFSSCAWVSSYLFAIHGVKIDTVMLVDTAKECLNYVMDQPSNYFKTYLKSYRSEYYLEKKLLRSKLMTMILERQLSNYLMLEGVCFKNCFSGSKIRKIEKYFENRR